jgi:hypothetical protein
MVKVQFFKEVGKPVTNSTLHKLCWRCYNEHEEKAELEHVEAALTWDECEVCNEMNWGLPWPRLLTWG